MQAYITPSGLREVDLTSPVRDKLLGLSGYPVPPSASTLEEADSVMGLFFAIGGPASASQPVDPERGGRPETPSHAHAGQGFARQRPKAPRKAAFPAWGDGRTINTRPAP